MTTYFVNRQVNDSEREYLQTHGYREIETGVWTDDEYSEWGGLWWSVGITFVVVVVFAIILAWQRS